MLCHEPRKETPMNRHPTSTREAQVAVLEAVSGLQQVDAQLTEIRQSLPLTTVATSELCGVLEVVQTDLLADAICTLSLVAGKNGHGD